MAESENGLDVTRLTAKAPTIVSIIIVVVTVLGSYMSTASKLDAASGQITRLQADNAVAHQGLLNRIEQLDARNREQERIIVELSTTLRVKGMIR